MKNTDPLEKDIEKRVCDYAKSLKMLVYKFTSPARSHVPDRIFITPTGVVFFVEFKRKGQKPTPAQMVEIKKIRATGAPVYIVDNIEAGKRIIEQMNDVLLDGGMSLPELSMPRVLDMSMDGGVFPEGAGNSVRKLAPRKDPLDEY